MKTMEKNIFSKLMLIKADFNYTSIYGNNSFKFCYHGSTILITIDYRECNIQYENISKKENYNSFNEMLNKL